MCIRLLCTPEGLPLKFQVLAGNRTDVATVGDMARKMEERFAHGTETDPVNRWRGAMQLTQAEAALRTAAIDIGLGPVFHQKNERVDAHLLVCFLGLALWRTLEMWMRGKGLGTSARKLVEAVGTIRSMDVCVPVKRGDREVTPSLVGGSKAGRGCCDVAGAPWDDADKGLAVGEKCGAEFWKPRQISGDSITHDRNQAKPGRFSWIGRACSICFRNSFVLRSVRASYRPAPRSLLGLRKHLLRNHFPPY